jgi:hypothetical protein
VKEHGLASPVGSLDPDIGFDDAERCRGRIGRRGKVCIYRVSNKITPRDVTGRRIVVRLVLPLFHHACRSTTVSLPDWL